MPLKDLASYSACLTNNDTALRITAEFHSFTGDAIAKIPTGTDHFEYETTINDALENDGPVPEDIQRAAGVAAEDLRFDIEIAKTRLGLAMREVGADRYRTWTDGARWSTDGGFESVTEIDCPLGASTRWKSTIRLFSPATQWGDRIIRTEHTLTARMGFLTGRLRVDAVNDGKSDLDWQWREGMMLGFQHDFF